MSWMSVFADTRTHPYGFCSLYKVLSGNYASNRTLVHIARTHHSRFTVPTGTASRVTVS